ncbi:MAG: hypothetical protein BWY94_02092 [Actinobacteria bacterium ADurb.BinA094]|nr:MAG: hypothetical protein BWY94_02092 [Actinobacteria bacterium ADurb.BinA094]
MTSGRTAAATLLTSVHGVVVHTASATGFGSPSTAADTLAAASAVSGKRT